MARMAVAMPTVRNVRVRGSGEESPGPHEDDCNRCAATPVRERILVGIRLVSDAVAAIGGNVEWMAWGDQAANVKAEVEMFGDWGDEIPHNVRIEHCQHYWDVRPRILCTRSGTISEPDGGSVRLTRSRSHWCLILVA